MLNSLSTCAKKCKADAIKFYYLDRDGPEEERRLEQEMRSKMRAAGEREGRRSKDEVFRKGKVHFSFPPSDQTVTC